MFEGIIEFFSNLFSSIGEWFSEFDVETLVVGAILDFILLAFLWKVQWGTIDPALAKPFLMGKIFASVVLIMITPMLVNWTKNR